MGREQRRISPVGAAPEKGRRADHVIATLAAKQHGVVTRMQLVRAGLASHLVDYRLKTGLLRPVHTGVYQVGPVVAARAREAAAVLACDAILSHWTAAAVRRMLPSQRREPVHVTALPGSRHRGERQGIRVHRSRIAEDEIARLVGLPITSAARTLLDLSGVATARELERSVAFAEREKMVTRDAMLSLLNRYSGRRGARRLRLLLDSGAAAAFTRSEAEERLLELIRIGGLPEPEMNVDVLGHEVDCFWKNERLIIEVDGYAYHSSVPAFLADRERDGELAAAGIQVVHVSWRQITQHSHRTLVQVAQALARSRR